MIASDTWTLFTEPGVIRRDDPPGGEEPPGGAGGRPATSATGVGRLRDGGAAGASSGQREQATDDTGGQGDMRANG